MKSKTKMNKSKEQQKSNNPNNKLKNLKSNFFIVKFFDYIPRKKSLETIIIIIIII